MARRSARKLSPLVAGVAAALAVFTAHAEEAVLRAVSSFATGTAFSAPFEKFVEKVNQEGKGLVRIEYLGGPPAMPPFEVGSAVSRGVVDMANVTSAFYISQLPAADALKLGELTLEEERQNGAWDYINQLHNEKMNVWFLARTGDNVPFHLYMNRELKGPDLKGLTIRVTPVYAAFFRALGANVVQTAPGEVYTALERGVVHGYGWPIKGVLDLGWQEVTKYRIDPGFYKVDVNVLVNLDRWKKLTDEQRDFLTRMARWLEQMDYESNPALNEEERRKQAEAGIKTITFEGADREKWLQVAREAGWKQVEAQAPVEGKKLRELLTRK